MRRFSKALIHRVYDLAHGQCECQREAHGHGARCAAQLAKSKYGFLGEGGWLIGSWTAQEGKPEAEDCEALCCECYERVAKGQ